jgi:hypothetical protein
MADLLPISDCDDPDRELGLIFARGLNSDDHIHDRIQQLATEILCSLILPTLTLLVNFLLEEDTFSNFSPYRILPSHA